MPINQVEKCTICSMNVNGTNEYLRHIRQVHGNDRQLGTNCPLCESKFVFTNLKSFIHHIRKHVLYSSSNTEVSLSLLPDHDEININNNDEYEQQPLYEYEQHYPLEEIKKFYIKMLLKLREGHVLPGNVMKTMALSLSRLIRTFSYYLLPKLSINADNSIACNFNDVIEKTLFEISRNEDSFISSCQLYFKFVKLKEIQLCNGNKTYYIPVRDVLMNLFEKNDFYECIKEEKNIYLSLMDKIFFIIIEMRKSVDNITY